MPGTDGSTGSVLDYELGRTASGTGQNSDLMKVTGCLRLAGTLNVTDAGGLTYGSYRIVDYGGTLTDDGLAVGLMPAGYRGAILPDQVNLVVNRLTRTTQLWDGPLTAGDGANAGGAGSWDNRRTNGTDAGAPGTVTVAASIAFEGLQFTTDGYTVAAAAGGTLTLAVDGVWPLYFSPESLRR